jgi:hypothetical protein
MQTVVAAYGYLDETDEPELWGPTGIVQRPGQISEWLALRHTDGATTQ